LVACYYDRRNIAATITFQSWAYYGQLVKLFACALCFTIILLIPYAMREASAQSEWVQFDYAYGARLALLRQTRVKLVDMLSSIDAARLVAGKLVGPIPIAQEARWRQFANESADLLLLLVKRPTTTDSNLTRKLAKLANAIQAIERLTL